MAVLEARDVTVVHRGGHRAVSGVSLAIPPRGRLGLVGESGSGKTSLLRALLALPPPTAGSVRVLEEDWLRLAPRALRRRRRDVQYVAQEGPAAFNPRQAIGAAIAEPLVAHHPDLTRAARRDRVAAAANDVQLDRALLDLFPFQLSGGQLQRAALARALVVEPRLLVLDEPTASLDVTVKAGILALIRRLAEERHLALLMVSHDLGSVRHLCTEVAVMQAGRIVELGPTARVLAAPTHAYTARLLQSELRPDPAQARAVLDAAASRLRAGDGP